MAANQFINTLSKSNSPTFLALVIGMLLILFFKEYFRALIRLKELKQKRDSAELRNDEKPETEKSHLPPDEKATSIVGFNFRLLEKYYEQHLVEYKLMARASLVIAILGFLVIIIGVFLIFANTVSAGIITSIAGLIGEAAATLFFKQNKIVIEEVRDYHKKLVSTQYLLTSISLAGELPDAHAVSQRERIIGNMLFLSNELHGSSSKHLFPFEYQETKSNKGNPVFE